VEESEAYRQKAVARAEGESSRFLKLLAEYEKAPDVTRERMYLETMGDVLGQTGAMVVDVKNSNNMLYLPVDRLTRTPVDPVAAPVNSGQEAAVPQEGAAAGKSARSQSTRGRDIRGPNH
jgi:membrane protease subunit HflK